MGYVRKGGHWRRVNVLVNVETILKGCGQHSEGRAAGRVTNLAIALAEVVQIECEGKWVGELSLFCPGILQSKASVTLNAAEHPMLQKRVGSQRSVKKDQRRVKLQVEGEDLGVQGRQ